MNSYIKVPNPTPNIGEYFESGFYTGMIWIQLVQSSTLMTIDTGNKSFTVPDMTDSPIVYEGQMLEIRSRTNPLNKMIGTVIGAAGNILTIDVTSIDGAGTFDDWSIMTRYRIIVAPKKYGKNIGIKLKSTNTAFPIGCQTLNDGWFSTNAMKYAGDESTYPAAWWARRLNINGYTDWYIPARDELELCFRNLTPTSKHNCIHHNRPILKLGREFTSEINGAYDDLSRCYGVNNNAYPIGKAYDKDSPKQTSATAFRSGGGQTFNKGPSLYWSSSEFDTLSAWYQRWDSGNLGIQYDCNKRVALSVRAVRRSII